MRRILTALAAFAAMLSPLPATAQVCTPFTDVAASDQFCTNIQWIYNRGVTLGCAANQFCPSQFVRRDQMAAFLYRLGFQNAFLRGGNAFGTTAVLGTIDNQPLDLRINNARVMRYEPNAISPNVIGGSAANSVAAGVRGATIAGGGVPAGDTDPDFSSETPNRVTDAYGTVAGGYGNHAGDNAGTTTDGAFATVGGGYNNSAAGIWSTVGGGFVNAATGNSSTIAGGWGNTASGHYSTVAGGSDNWARGNYSFAAGRRAGAFGPGSFSFADSNNFEFSSFASNAFRVRATGGVQLVTDINDGTGSIVWQCVTGAGSSWSCSSDRNQKQNLRPLDGQAVLERLLAMPVFAWNPKGRNAHVDHYGPTAQDFHAAFGLGDDDTLIGTQDADGVALAAIQGLNAKLEAQLNVRDAIIDAQAREIAALRRAVQGMLARMVPEGTLAQLP